MWWLKVFIRDTMFINFHAHPLPILFIYLYVCNTPFLFFFGKYISPNSLLSVHLIVYIQDMNDIWNVSEYFWKISRYISVSEIRWIVFGMSICSSIIELYSNFIINGGRGSIFCLLNRIRTSKSPDILP